MSDTLEQKELDVLIDLLRSEVREYGGLYNLLQRQQDEIIGRDPSKVLNTNSEVEGHMAEMDSLRIEREAAVRELAKGFGKDTEESLSNMIPFFPEYIRPMLQALVGEVNEMVRRTRQKARQNHLLLSRTMELTQEVLQSLNPENYSKTYTKRGRVGMKGAMPSRYRAFV